MKSFVRALWRYGGIIVQPVATVRALRPDEGLRDGLWLGLLYLVGMGGFDIIEAVASAKATANLGGIVMLAAAIGRVLLVPILVLVACETILGQARAHRRGLMLVPLLLVVSLGHELAVAGVRAGPYVPEIVGALLSLALTWRVRGAVPPEESSATPEPEAVT